MSWQSQAACRGKWELMYDGDASKAIALCARCPVSRQCQKESVKSEEQHGVWGGLTWEARMFMCPTCGGAKLPMKLGCDKHAVDRGKYVLENVAGEGAVTRSSRLSTQTNPNCPLPRYISHHTGRAYRAGCKCEASLAKALEYMKRTSDKKKLMIESGIDK